MPWAAGHALGGAPSARAAPSGRPCAAQGLQAGWPGRMLLLRPGMWHCPPSQMVLQRRPNAFIVGCSGSPAGHGAAAHSALPHAVAHPSRWPRAPGRHTGQSSGSCAHERGMGWGGGGALRGRPCAQHSVGPVGEASARTPQPGAARLCPPGPGPARHHAAPIVQAPGSPVFSPQTPTQTPPPPRRTCAPCRRQSRAARRTAPGSTRGPALQAQRRQHRQPPLLGGGPRRRKVRYPLRVHYKLPNACLGHICSHAALASMPDAPACPHHRHGVKCRLPDRAAPAEMGSGSLPLRLKASLNATRCPSASVSTSTCDTKVYKQGMGPSSVPGAELDATTAGACGWHPLW